MTDCTRLASSLVLPRRHHQLNLSLFWKRPGHKRGVSLVEWRTQAWAASANMGHLDWTAIKQTQRSWEAEVAPTELARWNIYQWNRIAADIIKQAMTWCSDPTCSTAKARTIQLYHFERMLWAHEPPQNPAPPCNWVEVWSEEEARQGRWREHPTINELVICSVRIGIGKFEF